MLAPSEGDNFWGWGAPLGSNLYPSTAHTLARCGHFSTLPTMFAGAGTLGDKRPYLVSWRVNCASTWSFSRSGKSQKLLCPPWGGHYSARHFQLLPGILAMVVAAVCSAQEAVQPRVVKKLKRPRTRSVIHRPSDVG